MITFGSDVADLILQRTLGENTLGLNNSINRMTTGYKVNQAKDNAAGYSIITDLSKKISSMLVFIGFLPPPLRVETGAMTDLQPRCKSTQNIPCTLAILKSCIIDDKLYPYYIL